MTRPDRHSGQNNWVGLRLRQSRVDIEIKAMDSISEELRSIISLNIHMKHIIKLLTLLVAVSAFWIGLLETVIPRSYAWLLPVYFIVSLGCYGLLMVGVGLMHFPTCPQEAGLLQQDIAEAKEFLKQRGVDVSSA
ncbi:dolichol-phosphate mannose synthase subunit 3-like [Fagus crenata]